MTTRVLVTGATGFIGQAFCRSLRAAGLTPRLYCRNKPSSILDSYEIFEGGDLTKTVMPADALEGVGCVVHLAALVTKGGDEPKIQDSPTVQIASNVAQAVERSETQRILVLSSIAAQQAEDNSRNARPYGRQKLAAEHAFQEILSDQKHLVILRPPAVYGEGMSGALAMLSKLIDKGVPLPLGMARTKRPYIALETLTALMVEIVTANLNDWSRLSNQPLCCCDPEHVDTASLIRMMARIKNRQSRLLPVPPILLRALGSLSGKSELVSGALDEVPCENSVELQAILGWSPTQRMPETLAFLRARD